MSQQAHPKLWRCDGTIPSTITRSLKFCPEIICFFNICFKCIQHPFLPLINLNPIILFGTQLEMVKIQQEYYFSFNKCTKSLPTNFSRYVSKVDGSQWIHAFLKMEQKWKYLMKCSNLYIIVFSNAKWYYNC